MCRLVIFVLVTLGCTIIDGSKQIVRLPPKYVAELVKVAINCVESAGLDTSVFTAILTQTYDDTDSIKTFLFCTSKGIGLASDAGIIDVEKSLEVYPKTVDKGPVKDALEKCQHESDNEEKPKEKFYKTFKCFQQNSPVVIEPV